MTSYMPNMMAALGTVRIRCGVSPPYRPTMPSSIHTRLKHWIRPVYFGWPPAVGACRNRVLATCSSCQHFDTSSSLGC